MLKTCSWCLLVVLVIGCDRGPRVAPVSGRITLDGRPLNIGVVTFEPPNGRASHGRTDASGHYELRYTREKMGALVGPHTVRIVSATEITLPNGQTAVRPQIVPPKYNTQSELRTEVADGDNELNFELTEALKARK